MQPPQRWPIGTTSALWLAFSLVLRPRRPRSSSTSASGSSRSGSCCGYGSAVPEETIFRGILQPTLQKKLGRWPGIVLTAVIFAAYHVHLAFALPRLVSHTCYGIILGVLRERTGTLWAPAFAHALVWIVLGSL